MPFTNYYQEALLNEWEGTAYAFPADLYVGLSTSTPVEAGTGVTEPAGSGYARVTVTSSAAGWTAATGGASGSTISNAAAITFPQASGAWGTVTYFVIYDAATAGNMLAYGALTTAQAIGSGNTPSFAAGALTVTLD